MNTVLWHGTMNRQKEWKKDRETAQSNLRNIFEKRRIDTEESKEGLLTQLAPD